MNRSQLEECDWEHTVRDLANTRSLRTETASNGIPPQRRQCSEFHMLAAFAKRERVFAVHQFIHAAFTISHVRCWIACSRIIGEVESTVWRSMKHMMPPMRTRTALNSARLVDVAGALKLPITPRLRISSSAPNINPLIPASDNIRFVASV